MLPPSWLADKNASKIVHPTMTSKHSLRAPESKSTYVVVSPIYCCYGAAILAAERYVCMVALGAFISISGRSHSAQTDVHMICKISSDITHLREHKLHTNYPTSHNKRLPTIDIHYLHYMFNISWLGYVSCVISIYGKWANMRGVLHNNQPMIR